MNDHEQANTCEWLQFIKDEINSLEEEKRFLLSNFIVIFPVISYLFALSIELLENQILSDIKLNIKILFLFSTIITFLQIFRVLYFIYVNIWEDKILGIINVDPFKEYNESIIVSFGTIISFLIILIYRVANPFVSNALIPLDILNSIFYYWILVFWLLESIIVIKTRKIGKTRKEKIEIIEKLNIKLNIQKIGDKEKKYGLITGMSIFIVIFVMNTISTIWILFSLFNLYLSPELMKMQFRFGFVIVVILFIYVAWIKPVYLRLDIIREKIKILHSLMGCVVLNGIETKARYDLSKYFEN